MLSPCFSLCSSTESPFSCSHCFVVHFLLIPSVSTPSIYIFDPVYFVLVLMYLVLTFTFVIYVALNIFPFTLPLMAFFMPNRFNGCPYFLYFGWFNQRSTSAYLTLYCVHHIHSVCFMHLLFIHPFHRCNRFIWWILYFLARLHCITSQQMVISIVPTMKTSSVMYMWHTSSFRNEHTPHYNIKPRTSSHLISV